MNRISILTILAGGVCGFTCVALGQQLDRQVDPAPAANIAEAVVRYDGYRSVRVTAQTPRQLRTVLALTDDVLTCEGPTGGIGTFDVLMSPEQYDLFLGTEIEHEVLVADLQAHIDAWRIQNDLLRAADSPWYEAFRDLAEVEARVDALAAAHPNLATLSVIGQSIEGRPIRMVRVTGPGATANRPAIVINGTQHSRESLSPMTTMWFLEQLLEQYASDPQVQALVNGIDFHIIPMVNPDGYSFVWSNDPMWRKNRREVAGSSCMGVDLNRNWGHQWGNNNGSSGNACNQTYRGTAPFSEPETQAVSAVIDALAAQGRMRVHMDVHSYGTLLLSPWGYTQEPPLHLPTMDYLGGVMREAIQPYRGTTYTAGQGSIVLYVVSGGSRDYSYGVHGAMGWTIELPGTNFHPPADQILPVARETELGLRALAEFFVPPVQMFVVSEAMATAGEPVDVVVSIAHELPGTGQLHYRTGSSGAFATMPLTEPTAPGSTYYAAQLPGAGCGQAIQYYISAQGVSGAPVYFPAGGAASPREVIAYEVHVAFEDDFESVTPGWTVWNHTSLTAGAWERVVPIGSLQNNIPAAPFGAAGGDFAFVTENGPVGGGPGVADVDGGPTILTSPVIDLAGAAGAEVSYSYWHYSVGGTVDVLHVDVSSDDGANWTNARTYTHQSGWRQDTINLLEFIAPTSTVRIRFSVADQPNNSVTESGLDDFVVRVWRCDSVPCYANCDGSTNQPVLNVDDFTCFINAFAEALTLPEPQQISHYANCDGSTNTPVLNVDDFTCFINAFAAGCP